MKVLISQWVTRMRQLTKSCYFVNMTDSLMKGRIVLGRNKATRGWMFPDKAVDPHETTDQLGTSEITVHQISYIKQ